MVKTDKTMISRRKLVSSARPNTMLTMLLASSSIFWVACHDPKGSAPTPTPSSTTLQQQGLPDHDPALATRLAGEGALVLDVRTAMEYMTGSAPNATNIPYDEVPERISEILSLQGGDKHKPIVVFCRSGKRSSKAKQSLLAAGFDQVTNLGGFSDWPE